jgi:gamma-glutamylcyclotransferase (GGCT)/AIG2-like uncharacterized protein YtfP
MKNIKIFVYGTLKRGFYNNVYLKHSTFIGMALTKYKYPMVRLEEEFPYLINDKNHGKHVKGELFEIDDITLKMLDILEDYPHLYTRETIELVIDGKEIEAITYFATDEIKYQSLEFLEEFVE